MFYAQPQLIDNSHSAFEQGLAITRQRDTACARITQAYAQALLQVIERLFCSR